MHRQMWSGFARGLPGLKKWSDVREFLDSDWSIYSSSLSEESHFSWTGALGTTIKLWRMRSHHKENPQRMAGGLLWISMKVKDGIQHTPYASVTQKIRYMVRISIDSQRGYEVATIDHGSEALELPRNWFFV